jgi:hypothetical protein
MLRQRWPVHRLIACARHAGVVPKASLVTHEHVAGTEAMTAWAVLRREDHPLPGGGADSNGGHVLRVAFVEELIYLPASRLPAAFPDRPRTAASSRNSASTVSTSRTHRAYDRLQRPSGNREATLVCVCGKFPHLGASADHGGIMPSGVVAVTGGSTTDVGISVCPVVVITVSPVVIPGSDNTVKFSGPAGASLRATPTTPMAAAALAPITADSFFT